jgi:hypothetical protein
VKGDVKLYLNIAKGSLRSSQAFNWAICRSSRGTVFRTDSVRDGLEGGLSVRHASLYLSHCGCGGRIVIEGGKMVNETDFG